VSRPQARLDPPEVRDGSARVRLRLGAGVREAAFGCREVSLAANPDAAFVAGLPVAMGLASSLAVPAGVSPDLLRASRTIQEMLAIWNPALRPVEVLAEPASTDGELSRDRGLGTAAQGSRCEVLEQPPQRLRAEPVGDPTGKRVHLARAERAVEEPRPLDRRLPHAHDRGEPMRPVRR